MIKVNYAYHKVLPGEVFCQWACGNINFYVHLTKTTEATITMAAFTAARFRQQWWTRWGRHQERTRDSPEEAEPFSGSSLEAHRNHLRVPPPRQHPSSACGRGSWVSGGSPRSRHLRVFGPLFQNCCKKLRCFMRGNRLPGAVTVPKKTLPDILITFFCKEMPVLLALALPIVCTRPCISTNSTRLGARTIRGNFAARRLWAAFNKLTFHSPTLACLPVLLKQLEDASRSSFVSCGTWHHTPITHFHFCCCSIRHKLTHVQTHRTNGESWASPEIHTDKKRAAGVQKINYLTAHECRWDYIPLFSVGQ